MRRLRTILFALPLALGVSAAVHSRWVCDDAFISLRCVDQFTQGQGLVYNPGERVECYTHFLWVVLLAALHRLGFDLVALARWLPIAFYAATLGALVAASAARRVAWLGFPVAAWCVALHPDMQFWASGGLETAAYTLCVTLAVLAAAAERPNPGRVATAAALATLFRPEGLLLAVVLAAVLWLRRIRGSDLVRFAAIWALLTLPHLLWRFIYYGDWLPNTFYAKSAGSASWRQGWEYVQLYFRVHPILLLAVLVTTVSAARPAQRGAEPRFLACAAVSLATIAWVLFCGGDFMFARFLVPITPLLYLGLETALHRQPVRLQLVGGIVVLLATSLSWVTHQRMVGPGAFVHGIVDEHSVYGPDFVPRRQREASQLVADLAGTGARVAIGGGQASLAYFAHFTYALESYGLTDREIARRPLESRGRPGHEKMVTEQDMHARRIQFHFRSERYYLPGALDAITFQDLHAVIVSWDPAIMRTLAGRPGVQFENFPARLDSIIAHRETLTLAERQNTWEFFQKRYFAANVDPERLARAQAALTGDP